MHFGKYLHMKGEGADEGEAATTVKYVGMHSKHQKRYYKGHSIRNRERKASNRGEISYS